MKYEFIYERRQTAGRMQAAMLAVSAVALVGAIFAFLSYGWLPGLCLLIMGSIAFALSQLFDLLSDLFASACGRDTHAKPPETEKVQIKA